MRDENFEGQPYSDQPNIPLAENIVRLQSQLTASQARVKELEETIQAYSDESDAKSKRIATLEQALREADTWARAEQAVIDCPEYSEKVQRALRSELEVPVGFKTIGDYLDRLRQKVITTISTALKDEKEGK